MARAEFNAVKGVHPFLPPGSVQCARSLARSHAPRAAGWNCLKTFAHTPDVYTGQPAALLLIPCTPSGVTLFMSRAIQSGAVFTTCFGYLISCSAAACITFFDGLAATAAFEGPYRGDRLSSKLPLQRPRRKAARQNRRKMEKKNERKNDKINQVANSSHRVTYWRGSVPA